MSVPDDIVDVLRQHAAEVDDRARFPVESLRALRGAGLFGLLVPKEFGGQAASLATFVDVARQLAGGCLTTAFIWAMHCQQVDAMVRFGTVELRKAVLGRVAYGDVYVASVTTEPGTGGHLLTAEAPLEKDRGAYDIIREAPAVTGGDVADAFLITARSSGDAAAQSVTLVYAERDWLDIERTAGWSALGMRGTGTVGLHIRGRIPPWAVIGRPGEFREVAVESMIPLAHLGWAACWLGAAQAALAQIIEGVRTGGRPHVDLSSDLVNERLARIRFDLELISAYLHRVCEEVEAAREEDRSLDVPAVQIHLNTLKLAASELSFRAVDRMIQLTGLATGYLKESPIPLERTFRDLRSASLNYANDRLWTANGALAVLDRQVQLI